MDPERRLAQLEDEMRRLRARVDQLEAASREPVASTPWSPAAEPTPSEPRVELWPEVEPPPAAQSLEARIGTRWVAAAGAAILLLGAIFFLQLAFDRGWIGPWARLLLGWTGGASLWVGGELLRRRLHAVYGQVVAAAGAAVAFATTWIAFGLPRYQELTGLPTPAGGILLACIGLVIMAHAALVRAPILAATALALAHLVGAAVDDYQAVGMTGTAALGIALAAAAGWRQWGWLLVSAQSLHFTLALHAIFANSELEPLAAAIALILATVASAQRQTATWPSAAMAATWLLGALPICIAIWQRTNNTDAVGWTLLALTTASLACIFLRGRAGAAAAGVVLAVFWPWLHFDQPGTATVWAIELASLSFVAFRWPRPFTQVATSALALFLALWALAEGFDGAPAELAWLLALGAATVSGWMAWFATRSRPDHGRVTLIAALLIPMAAAAALRDDPVVTLLWALEAAAALGAGALMRDANLRFGGLGVIAFVLARVVLIDMAGVDPVIRILAFLATGAILLGIGYAYARFLRANRDAS